MKKLIIFCTLIFSLASTKAISQTTDELVNQIIAADNSSYIGKPLDSLINALPPGITQMKIIADGRSKATARKLRIYYPNKIWIDLFVKEFTYMDPVDPNRVWDISLMRKEKLFITVIYKHTRCYINCGVY